jgi:hypothetical protein
MDACKLLQNMRWEEAFLLPYEENRVTRLQSLVTDKYTPPSSEKMPAGLASINVTEVPFLIMKVPGYKLLCWWLLQVILEVPRTTGHTIPWL